MKYPAKPAPADAPILDVIQNRWSPVIYSDKPLSDEQIASLFEAARWAPSNYNGQPWIWIYAGKNQPGRDVLESLLVPGNAWAKDAGLLMLSFGRKLFTYNGKPNRFNLHDTGAANGFITLQATSMGLLTHQMSGYDAAKANEALGVPPEYEPASMMAIGYPGDPSTAPAERREREAKGRERNPRETFVFQGRYSGGK